MAAVTGIVLAGAALAGAGLSAYGQYKAGQMQAQAARYNAAVARQQKDILAKKSEIELGRKRKAARRFTSKQRALYAVAGVNLTGSAMEVMEDTATEMEYDALISKYNTQIGMSGLESEARYKEDLAVGYKQAGIIGAGATLLTSASSIGSKYFKPAGATGGAKKSGGTKE